MTRRRLDLARATVTCAILVLVAPTPAGASADHLACYKAKEIGGPGRIQATADLVSGAVPPLATGTGCVIKGPPRLYCGPVTKANIAPPEPGGGPTQGTTKFLCYKVKCPKGAAQTASAKDQFGVHTVMLKAPRVLCAPASPSGAFLDDPSGL